MSKKVLYISPNGYLGGAERFILNACIGHLESGMMKPAILFLNDGEFVDIARENKIEVYELNSKFKFSQPHKLAIALWKASQIINLINPDIIHSTMPYAQNFISLIPSCYKKKKVWFQHGPVGGTLDKIASKTKCDLLIFNSKFLKSEHERTVASIDSSQKVHIQKLGINKSNISPDTVKRIRDDFLGNKKNLLFLSAGRICSWKGYETTIKALDNLLSANKEILDPVKFIIIGEAKRESDLEYERKLKQLGARLVENEILNFLPFKSNINDYYAASDVFIHSSNVPEPFGLVVAEAMLENNLIIGSNIGGVTEILKNNETGFTFNSHLKSNVEELMNLLINIFELNDFGSDPKVQSCIKSAKTLIEEKYSLESMTQELESQYMEILNC